MEESNKCVGCGIECGRYSTCRDCSKRKHKCLDCDVQIPLQYKYCKECNEDTVKPPQKLAERLIDLKVRCEKECMADTVIEMVNCMIALNFKINNYGNKDSRTRYKKYYSEK